jgi:hypothetical protein
MSIDLTDTNFPLYDHLLERVNKLIQEDPSNADISMGEIPELIQGVAMMDKMARDCIFVIVRIHSLRENQAKVFEVPYSGEKINKSSTDENNCDVKFDIRTFPPILRRMLLEFVRMDRNKNNL